ncbi:hypothetical protein K501DRAFT_333269 [Backusella circina FSU 941]|nr:hypothetical protein K501DRAFT_333269 [Backusella circina FSU 941]
MEDSQLLDWQQSSINPTMENEKHTIIMDEQQLREELIQRATTRLRRRLLEESLSDVMNQIIKMQTHLETIRVDTQTTIGSVTNMLDDEGNLKLNRQMDILERRLKSHKADLLSLTVKEEEEIKEKDFEQQEEAPQPSATMSRLSSLSLMSSLFGTRSSSASSKATSICSDEDDAKSRHHSVSELTEEEKRDRRRRRVRHQRQRYEESLKSRDSDDDCISQINGSETYDDKLHFPTCLVAQDDDVEAPFYDLSGKRSFYAGSFCGSVYCKEQKPVPPQAHNNIRRKRRQWQKKFQDNDQDICYSLQKYNQSTYDDDEECLYDCNDSDISSVMMSDTISTLSSFIPDLHHPLSPMTPPPDYCYYYNEDSFGSTSKNCMQYDTKFLPPDEWTLENLNQYHHPINNHHRMLSLYPQRNVLDDCMSFLDGLSENGEDDNGLREDMCLLLRNPDLCCRPLSEIQGTMNELRSKDKAALARLLNPATWIQLGVDTTVSAAYKTACTSLEWCRFLSVLSAAVVISLSKGPDDLKSCY